MGDYFLVSGIIGFIMMIIMFVIPYRLLKIREELSANKARLASIEHIMLYTESLKGIENKYLTPRKCVFCEKKHAVELMTSPYKCPHCGFSYKPGNIIYRIGDNLYSQNRWQFEKKKKKYSNIEEIERI